MPKLCLCLLTFVCPASRVFLSGKFLIAFTKSFASPVFLVLGLFSIPENSGTLQEPTRQEIPETRTTLYMPERNALMAGYTYVLLVFILNFLLED